MSAPVLSVAETRAAEASIIAAGTSGAELMARAGRAVAAMPADLAAGGRVVVVGGVGGNGGDGFVCGAELHGRGTPTTIVLVGEAARITGDAAHYLARLTAAGAPVFEVASVDGLAALDAALDGAAVIVDALFGIGGRPATGLHAEVIARMNAANATRLSVDVPSGLDADTGAVAGACVRADRTLALGAFKLGLFVGAGPDHAGVVLRFDLDLDWPAHALEAYDAHDAQAARPRPRAGEHKGERGRVLVVGGAPGTRGAGQLAALGALRAGAGRCTLAARPDGSGEVPAPIDVMTQAVPAGAPLVLPDDGAVVVGPGAGRDPAARALLEQVLASARPTVLDADALTLLGADPARARRAAPTILTPHPKEAAALLGRDVAAVEADRVGAAAALATAVGGVVVLKGARTVVHDGQRATINLGGSPTLATGGTGDVLAGVIGAFLAQGLAAPEAARLGVYVHAVAGEHLAARFGARGAVASDLPEAIAGVLATLER